VFRLIQEEVTLPNGLTKKLDVIRHPGAAAMVPVLDDGRVVLIRQYRHAVGGIIWEIPAGTLGPEESPADCARRELREEIGHEAGELRELGELIPVPGYSDERIHLFLAMKLREVSQDLDDDEVLEVEILPLERALAMIRSGEIVDAKSIVGLMRAQEHLGRTEKQKD
jgi:ADP-ribose pyrophosphatase